MNIVPDKSFFDSLLPSQNFRENPVPASQILRLPGGQAIQCFYFNCSCRWIDFVGGESIGYDGQVVSSWYERVLHDWFWYHIDPPNPTSVGGGMPFPSDCYGVSQSYFQLTPPVYENTIEKVPPYPYYRTQDISEFTVPMTLYPNIPQPNPFDPSQEVLLKGQNTDPPCGYRIGFLRYSDFYWWGGAGLVPSLKRTPGTGRKAFCASLLTFANVLRHKKTIN